jgi:hypothetical protein
VNQRKKIKNSNFVKRHSIKVLAVLMLISIVFLFLSFTYGGAHAATGDYVGVAGRVDQGLSAGGVVGNIVGNLFFSAINMLLYVVFGFVGALMVMAGILFDWAINPNNFLAVMNLHAIYVSWTIVRDFLNLAFIIVLLYSAFCTIFQVEKYHLKKILLTLVLMALLVNFSYPISRFLIDTSNMLMYYIIGKAFPWVSNESGLASSVVQFSGIAISLMPESSLLEKIPIIGGVVEGAKDVIMGTSKVKTLQLIAAIIFMFLLATTLLIMAMLLIIRIVMLAVLVIFSPVGFVASIFPSTKNYADMWWDQLFKQAFFGPIMAFMLYIALMIMNDMQQGEDSLNSKMGGYIRQKLTNGSNISSIVVAGCALAIPIVILWVGIIASQKMGAVGADMAKKAGLGMMNKLSGVNFAKRTYKAYQSRRDEAKKNSASNRIGNWLGSQQDRMRAGAGDKLGIADRGTRDARNRFQADELRKTDDAYKGHNMADKEYDELVDLKNSGDKYEKAAAIKAISEKGKAGAAELSEIANIFGDDSQVFKQIASKVKGYNAAAAFAHVADPVKRDKMIREFVNSNQFKSKDLSAKALSSDPASRRQNAEFLRIAAEERAIDSKDWEDYRKKDKKGASDIIADIAHYKDPSTGAYAYTDINNDAHREIQLAHLGQTGKFSTAVVGNRNFKKRLYKDGSEDTLKRMDSSHINPFDLADFEDSVSSSKLSKILPSMQNESVARDMTKHLRRAGGKHAQYMEDNPNLKGLYT